LIWLTVSVVANWSDGDLHLN
jgi:hypothetical protein